MSISDLHSTLARGDAAQISERPEPCGMNPAEFSGFREGRKLRPHRIASRWLTSRASGADHAGESYVVYQLVGPGTQVDSRTFLRAIDPLRRLEHPHILPIAYAWSEVTGSCHLASPYTGNAEGLLTLERLLRLKHDGRLSPIETRHLLDQTLSAIDYAHDRGIGHGPLSIEEILIDSRGRAQIELLAVARHLSGQCSTPDDHELALEIRSLAEIAFRAVTGSWPADGLRPASRRMTWSDRELSDWLETALHPQKGFASAREALRALPRIHRPRQTSEAKPLAPLAKLIRAS